MLGLKQQCSKDKLKQLYDSKRTCDWIPLTGGEIGRGTKGYTMQVCCNGECMYVVKILPQVNEKKTVREMGFQAKFWEAGTARGMHIAPQIIDAWSCDGTGYIIMEKVDTTVQKYVTDLANRDDVDIHTIDQILDQIYPMILAVLKAAHRQNLAHNDLIMDNIGLMLDPETFLPTEVVLIDFGEAMKVGSFEEAEQIDFKMPLMTKDGKINPENDIQLGINFMKTGARNIKNAKQYNLFSRLPPDIKTTNKKGRTVARTFDDSPIKSAPAKMSKSTGLFDDFEEIPMEVDGENAPMTPPRGGGSGNMFLQRLDEANEEDDFGLNFAPVSTPPRRR